MLDGKCQIIGEQEVGGPIGGGEGVEIGLLKSGFGGKKQKWG